MTQNDTTEQTTRSVTPETTKHETACERFEREQAARRRGLKKFGITSDFWDFMAPPKAPQIVQERTEPMPDATEKPGAEWERFERGQVSRRAALRKMGMTTGMAVFAMFSVDDLARMVGKAMEQRAGDSKIADQVAKEFQQSGIAFAAYPSSSPCYGCVPGNQCVPVPSQYLTCQPCCTGCSCQSPQPAPCNTYTVPATQTTPKNSAVCNACCLSQNPVVNPDGSTNLLNEALYLLCTASC